MRTIKTSLLICFTLLLAIGCKRDPELQPEPLTPFDIRDQLVAITIKPKTGSSKYTSVFFLQFLENNKALFISSSATNVVGNYTLTDSELSFEVTGGNARTAKFTLDKDKRITAASYKGAGPLEYETTGEIFPLKQSNQLAGRVFKGDEMGMSGTLSRAGLNYNFSRDISSYGSGTDAAAIDNTSSSYTLYGGNAFKATTSGGTEIGYVSNGKLTVFRLSSLYYSGSYQQQ
ncbi:MAG: hypothetical protein EOO05_20120 [Chitinophagaceae bacterium]|nr:MAG: hypothetical protein EOO05_20120 [Chitinophagaceae bacterium]